MALFFRKLWRMIRGRCLDLQTEDRDLVADPGFDFGPQFYVARPGRYMRRYCESESDSSFSWPSTHNFDGSRSTARSDGNDIDRNFDDENMQYR